MLNHVKMNYSKNYLKIKTNYLFLLYFIKN